MKAWTHVIWLLAGLALGAEPVAGPDALDAQLDDLRAHAPGLVEAISGAAPSGTTRHGRPRFLDEAFADPRAWPAIEARLLRSGEAEDVRQGLLAWLPHHEGWLEDAERLLHDLTTPSLRASVVQLAGRSRAAEAVGILSYAAVDTDALVRASAARGLARVPGADKTLRSLLMDPSAEVRAAAAFSVGVRGDVASSEVLEALLADASPEVRLASLRALERAVGREVGTWRAVRALSADADPTIRRRVERLIAP
jgi:HEAT repeat protein